MTAGKIKIALSSGVTVENVDALVPFVDYFIVGSSVHDSNEKILLEQVQILQDHIAPQAHGASAQGAAAAAPAAPSAAAPAAIEAVKALGDDITAEVAAAYALGYVAGANAEAGGAAVWWRGC